eukprot:TRINITY_DN876_c0_g3_i3.p2 TRINITY_DN876_c0_g3~~TRINITY_DN876_c0_g3_i3.p2  ORF type:complete len:208 (+),score=21.53 TRINITY_DN876_c0_g3_i3:69-626(+)
MYTSAERKRDLKIANEYLLAQRMPDGHPFEAIGEDSFFYRLTELIDINPSVGVLAASYMQRLTRCPHFDIGQAIKAPALQRMNFREEQEQRAQGDVVQPETALIGGESIQTIAVAYICTFLAVKICGGSEFAKFKIDDVVRMLGLNSLPCEDICRLEIDCANALEFRLGPVFDGNFNHQQRFQQP